MLRHFPPPPSSLRSAAVGQYFFKDQVLLSREELYLKFSLRQRANIAVVVFVVVTMNVL